MPHLKKNLPCAICGKTFRPRSNRQKYCRRCGPFGGQRTCITCKKVFRLKSVNSGGLFCTGTCRSTHLRRAREKQCPVCQQTFTQPYSGQETCSVECKNALITKKRPNCPICGTRVRKASSKFCSHSCAAREQNRQDHWSRRPDGAKRDHGSQYILIKAEGKWVMEHRLIMETKLGRKLEPHERVHHKDGDRKNNDIDNLELWKVRKKDPAGVRAADYHCPGCRCFEH